MEDFWRTCETWETGRHPHYLLQIGTPTDKVGDWRSQMPWSAYGYYFSGSGDCWIHWKSVIVINQPRCLNVHGSNKSISELNFMYLRNDIHLKLKQFFLSPASTPFPRCLNFHGNWATMSKSKWTILKTYENEFPFSWELKISVKNELHAFKIPKIIILVSNL